MSQALSLYKQECDIMERFDFAKVAAIMKVMDWKYAGSKESPTVSDLQYTAESLMNVVQRDINTTSDAFVVASTGGLEVAAYCYRGNWKMELKFIPVRCNAVI
jgi:hypothetical protein